MATTKTIPNFPNYSITDNGKVWSKKRRMFLKPGITRGYKYVTLCKYSKKYSKYIHKLVLETYIGLCPKGMEACHNNGNKADNKLVNLRWDTRSENQRDSVKHGGTKLNENSVMAIIQIWRIGFFTQDKIAKWFNVGQGVISRIVNKKTWKHIWR